MPKASSGPRGVRYPHLQVSCRRKEASQALVLPEQAWVSGLERALLALCRPRVFNSFWHIKRTRWKAVGRDPGAAEGRGGAGQIRSVWHASHRQRVLWNQFLSTLRDIQGPSQESQGGRCPQSYHGLNSTGGCRA